MKTYRIYSKDILRLLFTILATLIVAGLHTRLERGMGLVILDLALWLSFLLDFKDSRNHFRAARILTEQANVQFLAELPADFTRLVERIEKLAKSGITLDDLFPVDGVARNARPAVGGAPAEDLSAS